LVQSIFLTHQNNDSPLSMCSVNTNSMRKVQPHDKIIWKTQDLLSLYLFF
jgi:hypothetical protein